MKVLNPKVNLEAFFARVNDQGSLLMLDYDGTLAPFVKERMKAFPYPEIKESLLALAANKKARIVIVSGRSLSDLDTLLDFQGKIELWGSHGLERKQLDGTIQRICLTAKSIEAIEKGTELVKKKFEPESIENKPFGVALHWRGNKAIEISPETARLEREWERICTAADLEVHHFDGGMELRPKGWNKGDVVQKLMGEVSPACAAAYFGDDMTDEEAFIRLGDKALKVLVRKTMRYTLADLYLKPPHEVVAFLRKWR